MIVRALHVMQFVILQQDPQSSNHPCMSDLLSQCKTRAGECLIALHHPSRMLRRLERLGLHSSSDKMGHDHTSLATILTAACRVTRDVSDERLTPHFRSRRAMSSRSMRRRQSPVLPITLAVLEKRSAQGVIMEGGLRAIIEEGTGPSAPINLYPRRWCKHGQPLRRMKQPHAWRRNLLGNTSSIGRVCRRRRSQSWPDVFIDACGPTSANDAALRTPRLMHSLLPH